ncbi:MAG: hypothetical protein CBC76_00065 [Flavobacteriaceae bacterium TMED116]|nr:MAG: hypothetical protein CBC76_00065 [Flavobacteriaceae bacterium TMED116]|tara:strand:- start:5439 stop:6659 length:1221 start_codon:yes stop_codon:yes gene_type:complete
MKSYSQSIEYLYSKLPNYQKYGSKDLNFGLSNIKSFCKKLNNPETKLKTIHIAGTNGKGSVAHIVASILQSKGLYVGIYSSPHIIDFRERIKVNGEYISKEYITKFVNSHLNYINNNDLSFFELTAGLSFDYFNYKKVDYAIIEVGMGGRLDATNVINPEVSVITNIGYDHTEFLGNTLSEIAFEKAGIIKKQVPVIIGEINNETAPIFTKKAKDLNSKISFVKESKFIYKSDLGGKYQQRNIDTSILAIKNLKNFKISDYEIKLAIKNIKKTTNFFGRWDIIEKNPKIIIDVTHNLKGFLSMIDQLTIEKYEDLHLVLGFVKGKDVDSILKILPISANYYLCSPSIDRALSIEELSTIAKKIKINYDSYSSVISAYNSAKKKSKVNDIIIVSGSNFIVADFLSNN